MEPRQDVLKKLQENESFLSDVFSSIQDGISVLDTNFRIIRVNPTMEKWYTHAMPLIGKRCFEAYHSRDKACTVCPTRHSLRTGKPAYEVVPKRGPGGQIVGWLDLYAFPLIDASTGKMKGVIEYVRDITEKKKIEDELKRERNTFKLYLDTAPMIIVAINADRKVILINEKGCDILGYSCDEIIGKNWLENFLPKRNRREVKAVLDSIMAGELEMHEYNENPVLTRAGQERQIAWHNALLRDEHGRAVAAISSGEDITERKKAEDELRESEERYRILFENAPDVIYAVSAETETIDSLNPAFEKVTGWSRDKWIGKAFFSLVHPDDLPRAFDTFRQVLKGKSPPPYEIRIRAKSGEYLTGEFTSAPLIKGGKIIGEFGIARDITQRRKAEETLARSEEQYRLSYENIPLHMAVIDRSGKFVLWNKYSKKMFGYSAKEAIGKLAPPDIHETVDEAKKVVRTAARKGIFDGELNLRRKDGKLFPVHLIVVPYRNPKGEILNYFGFAEDITERKKLDRIKENLIRDVSHELKTPMALCQMSLNMLGSAMNKNDANRMKKAFTMAQGNVQRFRKDINNILTFSSTEQRRKIARQGTSISRILTAVLRDFHCAIDSKNLDVKTSIPEKADLVFMDKFDLKSVLTNVMDNAVKFTERGEIKISAARAGDKIDVRVMDTGAGIPKESIARVFEKFYKQTSSVPGVGLGLPICKEILERSGGKIKVDSKGEGKGTTVTITFPAFKGEEK